MNHPVAEAAIMSESDVLLARRMAHHLAELAGLSPRDRTQLVTAVSEIARNALQYAGGGWLECRVVEERGTQYLQFAIHDRGPGISNIGHVLEGGYRSKTGMGLGIAGTKKLMDRFSIESMPSEGTTVILGKAIPKTAQTVTQERASEWTRIMNTAPTPGSVERVRMQSHEMLRALEVMKHKESELSQQLTDAERRNRELLSCQATLTEQATLDPLTGLFNRREIMNILERELLRSRRTGNPVGVVMADLDHFKNLNDTHGHLTGDAALKEAAHRITSAIRPYDCVGRYGGEEFLVVLPECGTEETLKQVAERIRKAVGDTVMDLDAVTCKVTVSLGAATAERYTSAADLIDSADTALYVAKENGRDRVEMATKADTGQ